MEQDKPKNLLILGYTLAICAVLVATVIFVDQYLKADVRHEYEKKVLEAPAVDYRDLRASEDARLGRYVYVDQTKGIVRLPKERARELVLKEWASRPDGVVAPAATPGAPAPAAPAPAPAPTGATEPPAAGTGAPGAPAAPGTAAPTTAGQTPTQPGASGGATGAVEPPGTAQPAPQAPGQTPRKHPAQGTDGTKKDPGPGTDRSKGK